MQHLKVIIPRGATTLSSRVAPPGAYRGIPVWSTGASRLSYASERAIAAALPCRQPRVAGVPRALGCRARPRLGKLRARDDTPSRAMPILPAAHTKSSGSAVSNPATSSGPHLPPGILYTTLNACSVAPSSRKRSRMDASGSCKRSDRSRDLPSPCQVTLR